MSFKLPTQWTNNTNAIGKDLNLVEKQNASITNDLDMNSKKITNLANPNSDSDAVPKKYVNDNFLTLTRGTISGGLNIQSDIDMNGKTISDLATPSGDYDAVVKKYVDDELKKKLHLDGSATMINDLNMGENKIINLKVATNDNDAVSKVYVESNYLNKGTGGKVNGYIDVMQHKILNVTTPTANLDACNKQYCDCTFLKLTGIGVNGMKGSIYMGGYLLRGLPDPYFDDSATHKSMLRAMLKKINIIILVNRYYGIITLLTAIACIVSFTQIAVKSLMIAQGKR